MFDLTPKNLVKIFMFSMAMLMLGPHSQTMAAVGQISNQQLQRLLQQSADGKAKAPVLIDIRRPEEWRQTGVIAGSHLLTFFDRKGNYNINEWMQAFSKIVKDKETEFILICRSGNRTGIVSKFLDKNLQYKKVNHLSRGIKHWIKEGYPVVAPNIK